MLFYVSVKLGFSHQGKNIENTDGGCMRTRWWGECLDLKETWHEAGEDYTMRSFTNYYQSKSRWM